MCHHPIPERILKRIQAVTVVSVLVLQGCGHKGPLMLPPPPVQVPPVQTTSPQNPDLPSPQPYKQP
jgi:predicted small lipoprotein YifL